MHLKSITAKNFRRLKQTHIDLDKDTSIFVGANNSGKTSATYLLYRFLEDQKAKFSLHDFSSHCWKIFDGLGDSTSAIKISDFPSISLDLWFEIQSSDLHRVLDLLPSLDWQGTPVGTRIEFSVKDVATLLENYKEAKNKAVANKKEHYHPWPKTLSDYLLKNINQEFGFKFYVLDFSQFDSNFNSIEGYEPLTLGNDTDRPGSKIIKSIIRVDILNAQRHLTDNNSARSEDLSKRMNRFYERNLKKKENDYEAMRALDNSEKELTAHLSEVFAPTLESLNNLGYRGFNDPKLLIKAALNSDSIASQTKLHYSLNDDPELMALPDQYNGLGFKNLIYMVIEILDFHARWMDDEENRAPLHLIIIEEPEVHLHAQLQQVFIREIRKVILKVETTKFFVSQLVISTHSPHIIYESGFQPIRYFQREIDAEGHQKSNVLNLSIFYDNSKEKTRKFLQQYMKLTHCDLFFADGAILVEGNVERLLLPLMISKSAPELNASYISIIEVGGAFAHLFKSLINFLGLKCLIITDIDSMQGTEEPTALDPAVVITTNETSIELNTAPVNEDEDEDEEDIEMDDDDDDDDDGVENNKKSGKCPTDTLNAVTSNQTLIKWLPKLSKISELFQANENTKTQLPSATSKSLVYVAYQSLQNVTWKGETKTISGRTIEETFALENLNWTQKIAQKDLKLRVITLTNQRSLDEIKDRLYKRVNVSNFPKTDFALGLMMKNPEEWNVPSYIDSGLKWLQKQLSETPVISKLMAVDEKPEDAFVNNEQKEA
ncbi:ATP-dependent endonuclease [Flavobacterium qiangtangense]|uniref:ATP-dependent endonuclease n=1 Tax=Flavobacterium qiangtangense TaxID=1442595 RepID=A0ABW1PKI1_9FLAO